MMRSFPLELEHIIAEHSVDDLSVIDAQRRRADLRLVCRAWRDSIDLSRHLIVVGHNEVVATHQRICNQQSGTTVGEMIKSIRIEVKLNQTERSLSEAVSGLLGQVPNVGRVELLADNLALSRVGYFSAERGEDVIKQLLRLTKVRHFKFGDPSTSNAKIDIDKLETLVHAWPGLESLDLGGCAVHGGEQDVIATLSTNTALRRLRLGDQSVVRSRRTGSALPPSVESLTFDSGSLYAGGARGAYLAGALSFPPASLRHLALLDGPPAYFKYSPVARGKYDAVFASATSLQKLEISPCGVSDLSTVLAPLASLVELSLLQGQTFPTTPLGADEVAAFISEAQRLEKISFSANIHREWSKMGKREVHAAAWRRGVKDVLL